MGLCWELPEGRGSKLSSICLSGCLDSKSLSHQVPRDACLQGGSALQENTPTGSCHVISHPKTLWLKRQSFYFLLYLFARAAVIKYHESRALHNRILLAYSSGGWKPGMRVGAGQSPAEAVREAVFQAPQVLVAC